MSYNTVTIIEWVHFKYNIKTPFTEMILRMFHFIELHEMFLNYFKRKNIQKIE